MAVKTAKGLGRVLSGYMRTKVDEYEIRGKEPRHIEMGRTYVVFEENGGASGMKVLEPRYIIDVAVDDDPLEIKRLSWFFISLDRQLELHNSPGRLAYCASPIERQARTFRVSRRNHHATTHRTYLGYFFSSKNSQRLCSHDTVSQVRILSVDEWYPREWYDTLNIDRLDIMGLLGAHLPLRHSIISDIDAKGTAERNLT